MTAVDFNAFLTKQMEEARSSFFSCKEELEAFEQSWGPDFTFVDPWHAQMLDLSRRAQSAYEAYKKAWVEWYAGVNGYRVYRPGEVKSTESFITPYPTHELVAHIEEDAKRVLRKQLASIVNSP